MIGVRLAGVYIQEKGFCYKIYFNCSLTFTSDPSMIYDVCGKWGEEEKYRIYPKEVMLTRHGPVTPASYTMVTPT